MNTIRKSQKKQTLLRLILVLAILVLINIISIRVFGRIDLTGNSIYTLSDASQKLVEKLDDPINIKAYYTEDLPAPYNNNRRILLDMLNEYKAYAGGNIQYEFINPEGEEGEREAQINGIPPVEIQVVEEDKVEVKRAYLGLVMTYEDKKEIIPIVQNLASLEYDLSSAFKRLIQSARKKIGYSAGHEETDFNKLRVAKDAISKQYEIVPVDLASGAGIPGDITALMIIDPKTPFSDSAKYAIDRYLMGGGRLALLAGKFRIDPTMQNPTAEYVNSGIDDLLANYGIRINADLVKDAQCATILVSRQQGQFQIRNQVQFPFIPRVSNFNEDNMIVKGLRNVILQFTSSIDTSLAALMGIEPVVLAASSDKSGRQSGQIIINPFYNWTLADFPEKHIPLAALFKGSFKSFYAGRQPAAKLTKSPETYIVVVGTGQFMDDNISQQSKENLTFFANIIDYLADDSGLITIRSKDVSLPMLEDVSDGTKKTLKYGNMILPPVIIILFGLFRWRKRVAIKRSIEAQL